MRSALAVAYSIGGILAVVMTTLGAPWWVALAGILCGAGWIAYVPESQRRREDAEMKRSVARWERQNPRQQ